MLLNVCGVPVRSILAEWCMCVWNIPLALRHTVNDCYLEKKKVINRLFCSCWVKARNWPFKDTTFSYWTEILMEHFVCLAGNWRVKAAASVLIFFPKEHPLKRMKKTMALLQGTVRLMITELLLFPCFTTRGQTVPKDITLLCSGDFSLGFLSILVF